MRIGTQTHRDAFQISIRPLWSGSPVAGWDAPSIYRFVKIDEQRRILSFYSARIELGRPILAPPDVPADRVNALRHAFDATMADAVFLQEGKTMGLRPAPRKGEDIAAIVQGVMETPPELIKKSGGHDAPLIL